MLPRKELLRIWEQRLAARAVDSPRLSAQLLLAHVLRLDRLEMLLDQNTPVPHPERAAFELLATRRLAGEPVAYLVGRREFYGLELCVTPDVLIPRPESELMVDAVRDRFAGHAEMTILDVGTGSGALALACAAHFPHARVIAVDISRAALRVARQNARRLGLEDRIGFAQSDLTRALRVSAFQIILANLPYVPLRTRDTISHEVRDFEPHGALFSGDDGLDCYRRFARLLRGRVLPGTIVLCEIDSTQGDEMRRIFAPAAEHIEVLRDYAGLDRVVVVVF